MLMWINTHQRKPETEHVLNTIA